MKLTNENWRGYHDKKDFKNDCSNDAADRSRISLVRVKSSDGELSVGKYDDLSAVCDLRDCDGSAVHCSF